jgi:hypothetical protein
MIFGQVHPGQVDQDIPPLDANRIRGDAQIRNERAGAGRGIELPSVPGTGHDGAVERALTERAAVMRADAVDGADVAGYIAESVEVVAVDDFEKLARGQFVELLSETYDKLQPQCPSWISSMLLLFSIVQQSRKCWITLEYS